MRYVLAIPVIIYLLAVLGHDDYNEAELSHKHHCQMVELWEKSNGENGHPNYDGRQCTD